MLFGREPAILRLMGTNAGERLAWNVGCTNPCPAVAVPHLLDLRIQVYRQGARFEPDLAGVFIL